MNIYFPECGRCHNEKPCGPFIKNEIWFTQIPPEFRHTKLCKDCMLFYIDPGELKNYYMWKESLWLAGLTPTEKQVNEVNILADKIMANHRYWDTIH
jgi:hypothetical protein